MKTFAYEYPFYYEILVTDGTQENSYNYHFTKEQDLEISIKESKLLAEHDSNLKNPIPISV